LIFPSVPLRDEGRRKKRGSVGFSPAGATKKREKRKGCEGFHLRVGRGARRGKGRKEEGEENPFFTYIIRWGRRKKGGRKGKKKLFIFHIFFLFPGRKRKGTTFPFFSFFPFPFHSRTPYGGGEEGKKKKRRRILIIPRNRNARRPSSEMERRGEEKEGKGGKTDLPLPSYPCAPLG